MTKFGALPPPGVSWQIGKTSASITFVRNAEAFLETCQDAKKTDILRRTIEKVKNGSLVFGSQFTVEEYLSHFVP